MPNYCPRKLLPYLLSNFTPCKLFSHLYLISLGSYIFSSSVSGNAIL